MKTFYFRVLSWLLTCYWDIASNMGITLEQYRSRVGSRVNCLRQRQMNRCLTGKFWNTLLMLFYLNVFYLPTLKHMDEEHKKMKEVTVWFIKMVCYHKVYVPGLLRLLKWNNVKTNPGPSVYEIVNPTETVCADFRHWGCHGKFG